MSERPPIVAVVGPTAAGKTDLSLAPADPVRERLFGPADGRAVTGAINDLVAAFLSRHVEGRPGDVAVVAARHPAVTRHTAAQVARWTR